MVWQPSLVSGKAHGLSWDAAGHHEADFGMQWCAGFTGDFWQAYHEIIPKAPGEIQLGKCCLIDFKKHLSHHHNSRIDLAYILTASCVMITCSRVLFRA